MQNLSVLLFLVLITLCSSSCNTHLNKDNFTTKKQILVTRKGNVDNFQHKSLGYLQGNICADPDPSYRRYDYEEIREDIMEEARNTGADAVINYTCRYETSFSSRYGRDCKQILYCNGEAVKIIN